jgi:hypothetical protein
MAKFKAAVLARHRAGDTRSTYVHTVHIHSYTSLFHVRHRTPLHGYAALPVSNQLRIPPSDAFARNIFGTKAGEPGDYSPDAFTQYCTTPFIFGTKTGEPGDYSTDAFTQDCTTLHGFELANIITLMHSNNAANQYSIDTDAFNLRFEPVIIRY